MKVNDIHGKNGDTLLIPSSQFLRESKRLTSVVQSFEEDYELVRQFLIGSVTSMYSEYTVPHFLTNYRSVVATLRESYPPRTQQGFVCE